MTVKSRELSFDCLAFKDRVQEEIYEETKDLSRAETISYFRERAQTGPLAQFWNGIPVRNPRP